MAKSGPLWLHIGEERRRMVALLAKRIDCHLSGFISNFFCPFTVGDNLDVKDPFDIWYAAKVLDLTATAVFIRYVGWKDQWNEWIEWQSPRLALWRTNTPRHIPPSDYPRMYQQLVSGNDAGARGMLVIVHSELCMVMELKKGTDQVLLQHAWGLSYYYSISKIAPLHIHTDGKFWPRRGPNNMFREALHWGNKYIRYLVEEGMDDWAAKEELFGTYKTHPMSCSELTKLIQFL